MPSLLEAARAKAAAQQAEREAAAKTVVVKPRATRVVKPVVAIPAIDMKAEILPDIMKMINGLKAEILAAIHVHAGTDVAGLVDGMKKEIVTTMQVIADARKPEPEENIDLALVPSRVITTDMLRVAVQALTGERCKKDAVSCWKILKDKAPNRLVAMTMFVPGHDVV